MLTLPEKMLFVLAVLASLYAATRAASRIVGTIRRGQGKIDWDIPKKRIGSVLAKTITLQPVFRLRFWPSLFHGFVAWGFIFYLLVNLGDILEGFIANYTFLGEGLLGNLYRFTGDEYLLVVNASNRQKDWDHLNAAARGLR